MNELQSFSQVLQNKLFRIPDYQRGYAWQDSQLRLTTFVILLNEMVEFIVSFPENKDKSDESCVNISKT